MNAFNRIVCSFKADGLMLLQRHEAAISMMAEYIYKAVLDDEGFNTLLYLDQKNNSDTSHYQWFAGITTPSADVDSLQKLFMNNKQLFLPKTSFKSTIIPVLPSPKGFRESLVIWE